MDIPTCKGLGKVHWDFIGEYVLGTFQVFSTNSIEQVVQKHNFHLMGKILIVINEASCTKEVFKAWWDKLKNLITDTTISIEPKFKDPFQIDNFLNYVILSNHKNSILLENAKERRYWCLEVSEEKCQDFTYFDELRKKCFNQNVGNHFYTYMINYNPVVGILECPETELKKEIVEMSMFSPLKFLLDIKKNMNTKSRNVLKTKIIQRNQKMS